MTTLDSETVADLRAHTAAVEVAFEAGDRPAVQAAVDALVEDLKGQAVREAEAAKSARATEKSDAAAEKAEAKAEAAEAKADAKADVDAEKAAVKAEKAAAKESHEDKTSDASAKEAVAPTGFQGGRKV